MQRGEDSASESRHAPDNGGTTADAVDEDAVFKRFTIWLVAMGAITLTASFTLSTDHQLGNPWMLAAFGVAVMSSSYYSSRIHNGTDTTFSFDEAFFAAALLMFTIPGALISILASEAIARGVVKERTSKKALNLALVTTCYGTGALVTAATTRFFAADGASLVLTAAIGALVCTVQSTLIVNRIVAELTQSSVAFRMKAYFRHDLFQPASAITLGLLCGIAGLTFSWSPILVAPVLGLMHVVEYRHQRAIRDRQRIDGLFAVAMTAHEDVDLGRVEGVVTQAVMSMLSCRSSVLTHQSPGDGEIGARLMSDTGVDRWLVASGPALDEGFTDDDRYLVEAIGRIGHSALRTAELIEHIRWQGTHDERTGLPNQALFDDRVDQAISRAMRDRERLAVVCVNLDGFRRVNESFGFDAGDEILTQVADRLHGAVREIDTVARMAADQFMLLLPSVGSPSTVSLLAQRVLEALNIPYHVGTTELFITASAGISTYPEHGATSSDLLRNAESAVHVVKEDGGNGMRLYSTEMNADAHTRLSRESELHSAIDRGELFLMYQPLVELVTGRTVGVEALVRWQHPVLGLIPPDEFIPLAEESGLILTLDTWVLRTACKQLVRWSAEGLPPIRVAVNLSGRHFHDPKIIEVVQNALSDTRLTPERLELEITERVALRDGLVATGIMNTLRQMGVKLSIDDFGTGYSALAQLQTLAVDHLKIDRSFTKQIEDARQPAPLVTAFLAMARALGMGVIAEGIETVEQRDFLLAHGCDEGQGYLFAKPLLPADLAQLVMNEVSWSRRAS